ncbi:FliM/FliN family flagellar motor switch protein [Amnibacterium endophyticum]|uniref:Flagellar motor switch protein FliM n=1 Tax=Amnibacterium endophyticum TaxID=2109337 RepID=A0ABW4LCD5_9MICO
MTTRSTAGGRVHAPGSVLDVQPYDFASPELLSADARDRLDSALEAWGRQVGTQITAKTRAVVDVATAPSRVQTHAAFLAPEGPPALEAVAHAGDHRVVYRVPLAEARYWAARMIGASGAALDLDTPLSAIERALAWRVVDEHLAELHDATDGLLPRAVVESFGAGAGAVCDPDELAVTVVVGTLRRGERGRLGLAIPVPLALEALGAVAPKQDAAEVQALLSRHLAVAPIEVALRFDETPVGPSTVLDLAVGDLIPLAHLAHHPLVVEADGAPVLRVAVGSNGDRLACIVVESDGGSPE